MLSILYSKKDIESATKMCSLFLILSEKDKIMANGYVSALADKTIANKDESQQDESLAAAARGRG